MGQCLLHKLTSIRCPLQSFFFTANTDTNGSSSSSRDHLKKTNWTTKKTTTKNKRTYPEESKDNRHRRHRSRQDSSESEVEKTSELLQVQVQVEAPLEQQQTNMSQESESCTLVTAPARAGVPVGSKEYENMISGLSFKVLECPELLAKKLQARRFCHTYNGHDDLIVKDDGLAPEKLFVALREERRAMLRTVIGKMGDGVVIEPPFNFQYGFNIIMGDGCYANVNLRILDSAIVTIGDRVWFGPNVTIVTERHDKDIPSRRQFRVYAQPVSIGDDCWIGVGTTILGGVSIGKGSTIGAGSVVTRDVPPFSVAWGVPCRVVEGVEDPDADQSN